MPASSGRSVCADCGAPQPRTLLGDAALCDRCYNARVSARTGWPDLPDPPPVEHVRTADGRSIPFRYRLLWTPAGLMSAEAEQADLPPGDGYCFRVLGDQGEEPSLLQSRLRAKVRGEVGRAYLERPSPDAPWRIADTEAAGRLDWDEDTAGALPSVVIDGRRFDWEAFGRMLTAFEGWDFRLEVGDGSAGEASAAPKTQEAATSGGGQVIPLFGDRGAAGQASIDDALAAFLVDQKRRLAATTYRRYADIVDLLRACLNAYGHRSLSGDEARRVHAALAAGESEAFTRLCEPQQILAGYGEFLGHFLVQRMAASKQQLRDAGTVSKKLARWLADRGHVDRATADAASEHAAAAARELPQAHDLTEELLDLAARSELPDDPDELRAEDWIEDQLPITRVEDGRLWFDSIGPVAVPRRASDLAEIGWQVTVVLARTNGSWQLVEVGFVYP